MRRGALREPPTRSSSSSVASAAIRRTGCASVVSGGLISPAHSGSPKATIATSCGIRKPASRIAPSAPIVIRLLPTISAEGRSAEAAGEQLVADVDVSPLSCATECHVCALGGGALGDDQVRGVGREPLRRHRVLDVGQAQVGLPDLLAVHHDRPIVGQPHRQLPGPRIDACDRGGASVSEQTVGEGDGAADLDLVAGAQKIGRPGILSVL